MWNRGMIRIWEKKKTNIKKEKKRKKQLQRTI